MCSRMKVLNCFGQTALDKYLRVSVVHAIEVSAPEIPITQAPAKFDIHAASSGWTRLSRDRVLPYSRNRSERSRPCLPTATSMDRASHLSLILDLSPSQWHLSSEPQGNQAPLTLSTFLSHVLTFVNSHVASKPENTLSVFGALPGKRCLLPLLLLRTRLRARSVYCSIQATM